MNFTQTITSAFCLLALVGISQAFYHRQRIFGLSEDPCGPTLAVYRRLGVVAGPPEVPNPNATTVRPNTRRAGDPYAGYYQMSRYNMMSNYDAPDLPDMPAMGYGLPGAGPLGNAGGIPPGPPMDCRCDPGIECQPLGGSAQLPRYAHQCSREMGLVCCCSTGTR